MEYLWPLALIIVIGLVLRSSIRTMVVARNEAMRRTRAQRAVMAQQLRLMATLVLVLVGLAAGTILMVMGGG
jgi:hypothetical protein